MSNPDSNPYAIFNECSNNNLDKVRDLLDQDPTLVNFTNAVGMTPLHIACIRGNIEMINFLLSRGANTSTTNDFEKTPIFYAENRHKGNSQILEKIRNIFREHEKTDSSDDETTPLLKPKPGGKTKRSLRKTQKRKAKTHKKKMNRQHVKPRSAKRRR